MFFIKNSTFTDSEPTWSNACVGHNGNPSYVEYAKGFSVAANNLLEKILERHAEANVDELIYPICFNMRHSIELRLKGAIEELIKIGVIKSKNLGFNFSSSHDIGNIWSFFKIESLKLDSRFYKFIILIDQTVLDVAAVDATGQTFRYPIDVDNKKHLIEIGNISCHVLWEKFKELEKNLDDLHCFIYFLKDEYELGTFTSKLSRPQLFNLAKDLPARDSWSSEDFRCVKLQLREKYKLSSNDLTKAINLIQKNYEMAKYISMPMQLHGLTCEQLRVLVKFWVAANPNFKNRKVNISYSESDAYSLDLAKLQNSDNLEEKAYQAVCDSITPEYLAGLNAIFYFARDLRFCEYYSQYYDWELKSTKATMGNDLEVKRNFMHIFRKSNFIDNVLTSLYFLYFYDFADSIVKEYELNDCFEFLSEVRSRTRFKKPVACGY